MSAFMQWLHLMAAAIAVGGLAFLCLILLPSLRSLEEAARGLLLQSVLPKFRLTVWTVIVVLTLTGVYNIFTSNHLEDRVYRHVLEAKLLLAFILFAISFGLTLPSPALAGMQKQRPRWLVVSLALGVIILLLAAYLRRI